MLRRDAQSMGSDPIHLWLETPDEYRRMDPELVQQIEASVAAVLGL